MKNNFYLKEAYFEKKSQVCPNSLVFHRNLSDCGKLLILAINGILSNTRNWNIRQSDLQTRMGWGREKIRSAIKSCVENGYIKVHQSRCSDSNHKFKGTFSHNEFEVCMEGSFIPENITQHIEKDEDTEEIQKISPMTGYPSTVDPSTVNQALPIPKSIPLLKNDDEYYNIEEEQKPSVVVSLDEEKEKLIKSLDLDDCAISFVRRFSVEEIKIAIKAVSQKGDVPNYSSTMTAALRDKWKPTTPKEEIKRKAEEEKERLDRERAIRQSKTYESEIHSLAKQYQGKLADGWDIKFDSEGVIVKTSKGIKPLKPTKEDLNWLKVIVDSKCLQNA